MDHFPIEPLDTDEIPPRLREIPQPPERLSRRGRLPKPHQPLLSVVGSRKYTSYGKQVVDELIAGLAGSEVGIVSGLALGIDSLAHEAALRHGLYTLAIPGGGLADAVLYPARHRSLAHRILAAGGGLLSEFADTFKATTWSFPQRNRLVAGISHGTLLIEAGEKSGTLITARFATDYNRELMVVPGSIFSGNSRGVHQFLKLGAIPVTTTTDILDALGLDARQPTTAPHHRALTDFERTILTHLTEPTHRDDLVRQLAVDVATVNQTLMQLELEGLVSSHENVYRNRTHEQA